METNNTVNICNQFLNISIDKNEQLNSTNKENIP